MRRSLPKEDRRQVVLAAASLPFAALAPSFAFAQSYPTKTIRLICPFPPAGAVDIACRALAAELSKQMPVAVTVENRPGAGGNVGLVEAVKSAADGYTVYMSTSGIQAINPVLYSKMPADPNKELAPISALVSLNNVLVLHPSVKSNSVKELIAYAKANPGKLTYASSGNGTSIHMSGEMFKALAGVDMVHVPYKGSAPALTDLLGGQVQLMFDNIPSAIPHIKNGKLKALATTGAKRDPALADLPTIAETGVTGYESDVWFGLTAPVATPKEIIARLSDECQKAVKSASFVKRMTELGYNMLGTSPEQMAEMTRAAILRWAPIVKSSGAKVD
ncbi:MAG: tripartite tricarboxylate transporter substrate binding protein [Betaproteobacteria bacterium]|nr:tripartite tricarboxylate transporter substrate binding protein [Betaproteobacteria bacterium]NBU01899.1 tripartite tricarboxylate transporter substrate binding protein [Betaproteobacteria bacterium]